MTEPSQIAQRKDAHLDITLEKDVRSGLASGFGSFAFVHQALPEVDYAQLQIETLFLGKKLRAPFLISGMTGGTERAKTLNIRLAKAAHHLGIAMGLGSMRILLEDPSLLPTFNVRPFAPDALLFGNLGAIQLNKGVTVAHCQSLVDQVQADALVLHLNPLQELVQPEGDREWGQLLSRIGAVTSGLSVPVLVKEVGAGLSPRVIRLLREVGVQGLDVAGAGGTSWSQVESYRADTPLQQRLASSFRTWGIPTTLSLKWATEEAPELPLIASGGILSGIDAAKAIHLGAHLCGIAQPLLKAAHLSEEAVVEEITLFIEQLKVVLMCTASRSLQDLRHASTFSRDSAS